MSPFFFNRCLRRATAFKLSGFLSPERSKVSCCFCADAPQIQTLLCNCETISSCLTDKIKISRLYFLAVLQESWRLVSCVLHVGKNNGKSVKLTFIVVGIVCVAEKGDVWVLLKDPSIKKTLQPFKNAFLKTEWLNIKNLNKYYSLKRLFFAKSVK